MLSINNKMYEYLLTETGLQFLLNHPIESLE